MKLNLYEHNQTAYEKAIKLLNETGKAAVIHPTGTGKSFIAFKLAEDNPDKDFLWIAPSEYIYRLQTDTIRDDYGIVFKNITFRTYSWLHHNRGELDDIKMDYLVLDEFHRAGALKWEKSVRKLIDDNRNVKIVGLSATNIRYLDNHRDIAQELFDGFVASEITLTEAMSRKILPIPKYVIAAYDYEARLEALNEKISHMKSGKRKEISQEQVERLRRALEQAKGIDRIFEKHITEKTGKYIVFCAGINHLYEMISKVPEWFRKIDTRPHIYYISSYNPESQKDFKAFLNDNSMHLKLLFAIDMVNEGIHVPNVDGIVLLRPTISPIVYKQQIGRALSTNARTKPVIFDMVNNFDSLYSIDSLKDELNKDITMFSRSDGEYIDYGGFEIIDELKDFRQMFETLHKNLNYSWEEYFGRLQEYKKENGTVKVPKRYITYDGLRLGRWVGRQKAIYSRGGMDAGKIKLLEAEGFKWMSESDESFERWMELLIEYKNRYGHSLVPTKYVTKNGKKLGLWCQNIRRLYQTDKLQADRMLRLKAIRFNFDTCDNRWKDGFEHAKKYYKKHGNLMVEKSYKCRDGYKLGQWILLQRAVYQGKATGIMDKSRIKKLESIGMVWYLQDNEKIFNEKLKAYRRYFEKFHEPVISKKKADSIDSGLYNWVCNIRKSKESGKLSNERIAALEEAGFIWDNQGYLWDRKYEEVKGYYNKHGSLRITEKYCKKNGVALQSWLTKQRTEYVKPGHGKLTEEQIQRLNLLGMVWDKYTESTWNKGCKAFGEYVSENKDAFVPWNYVSEDGFKLGKWISDMKEYYKNGTLSEDRIRELNKLGMIWESNIQIKAERYWKKMFKAAKIYYRKHGNLNVPCKYVTKNGEKLGQWIACLRKKKTLYLVEKRLLIS